MKKMNSLLIVGLLLIGVNIFADDVRVDSNGNLTTGLSSSGNLEVTGASAERAIVGISSGTGGEGVRGENTTYGNFGILGGFYTTSDVGVYGFSTGGYAGYFDGDVNIVGDLTVSGSFSNPHVHSGGDITSGTVLDAFIDPLIARDSELTWWNLSGIPAGFADGIDDTGGGSLWTQSGSYIYYNSGNVGIGIATPNEQLEITGNLRLPATTATTGIIMSGADTLIHTFSGDGSNFFAGINAGNLSISARYSTATGNEALYSITTGWYNTANGYHALYSNTTGSYNTANGGEALYSNTTGSYNTANGYRALYNNITGTSNTAIGMFAGPPLGLSDLTNATAIGYGARVYNSNNVVIGNSNVTSIGGFAFWSNFSDQRLKTDIQSIEYGLDLIRHLRPVSFKMKNGNGNNDFGFIAQDIEALVGDKYNLLDIGGDEERMLSLRYSQFIAPMVKAMQEQQEQIDELKKIVEELRKRS